MITVLEERPARLPLAMACRVLGINRSTVYAWRKRRHEPYTGASTSRRHCPQPRALSAEERAKMLEIAHSEPYRDQPVYEIYHDLLQQGIYLGSLSTWYRQLREAKESGDRRPQRAPQHHAVPRITARAANEAWTWDISKLPTRRRGVYLNLYVVLDLYSRFIVAWMVSHKENAALAQQLFQEAVDRYGIPHGALTLHQDRGSPMIARSYLDLMGELGVTCSHSRPRVSNDNPFSESQFKTSKYQPDYPGRFESIVHARQWYSAYVDWYNLQHHHSGLAGFTPEQVFTGRYREIAEVRQRALDDSFEAHPERFLRGRPKVALPPDSVSINPVQPDDDDPAPYSVVNFPTLSAAGATATKSTLIFNDLSESG
ncbi:IS3 family transposase [Halomonas sp. KAO]|uniref:IS3 family transposase n=1 Tax=Halomonas sp. KAO TaxID=2783858 RepID=UPI00189DCC14|nr:IS3 family transposase [Halomonas sp. KAO]MBF7053782.1 IS3 family transposase [Halomonas sp. KAO]